jgi:hypothetical protein
MEVKGWRKNNVFRIGKVVRISRKTDLLAPAKSGPYAKLPQGETHKLLRFAESYESSD